MSITTELREYASSLAMRVGASTYEVKGALEEIADRIDAALGDYVQLPKDADGKPIHLQDRVRWDNGTFDVHELKLDADGWTTWDELHGYTVRADQCHHAKPDSWESIIVDALHWEGSDVPFAECHMTYELVERCKRLAGEGA